MNNEKAFIGTVMVSIQTLHPESQAGTLLLTILTLHQGAAFRTFFRRA